MSEPAASGGHRRTLVYKRTHLGDPCRKGVFGCWDCMGKVRWWRFDAVIGIGGIGQEAQSYDIAGKVCWVGIGPTRTDAPPPFDDYRGPLVSFANFHDFGTDGDVLACVAPNLARRMYDVNVRATMTFSPAAQQEIDAIVAQITGCPGSRTTRKHRPQCGSTNC